jgi:hypothetical protein
LALSYEASAFAQAQPFTTVVEFHASGDCPYPLLSSINRSGVIAGSCSTGEPGAPANGFIRDSLGNIAIFNPTGTTGTAPVAINGQGFITGYYNTSAGQTLGFVRTPDGTITSFDFIEPKFPTLPTDVNASGAIIGSVRGGITIPAFLRSPDGTLTGIGFIAGIQRDRPLQYQRARRRNRSLL